MPLYARHDVQYAWLIDPKAHTLEAYVLQRGKWATLGTFRDDDPVSVAPYSAITIQLNDLWT